VGHILKDCPMLSKDKTGEGVLEGVTHNHDENVIVKASMPIPQQKLDRQIRAKEIDKSGGRCSSLQNESIPLHIHSKAPSSIPPWVPLFPSHLLLLLVVQYPLSLLCHCHILVIGLWYLYAN